MSRISPSSETTWTLVTPVNGMDSIRGCQKWYPHSSGSFGRVLRNCPSQWRFEETSTDVRYTAASLIGSQGQALSGHPPLRCQCRSRALASLRTRHQGPSIMGFEDEVEQSFGRPCRECDSRSKRTYDLTSSIVPRGTSFRRWADLRFSRI